MYNSSELRRLARKGLKGFWGLSLIVTLMASILGGTDSYYSTPAFSNSDSATTEQLRQLFTEDSTVPYVLLGILAVIGIISLLKSVIKLVFGGAIEQGLCRYNIDLLTRENKPAFGTLFSCFKNFGKAFGLQFMMELFVALWTLLFIIPGIIAGLSYSLAPYLMAEDPSIGIMAAIRRSKELMKGKKWKLFCLNFSFIGWALLSFLTLGIGFLWLEPYVCAANAAFYLDAVGKREKMAALA